MSESSDNFGTKFCQFKGKYSAEYSAEYSVKLGRIFGIGRYQFFLYRSFTTYKCDSCEKSFGQKGNLVRHFRNVHKNIKSFECGFCDKKYQQKRTLEAHIKSDHQN